MKDDISRLGNWEDGDPFTKRRKMGRREFGMEEDEFLSIHVNFKMLRRHPDGFSHQAVANGCLEFRKDLDF